MRSKEQIEKAQAMVDLLTDYIEMARCQKKLKSEARVEQLEDMLNAMANDLSLMSEEL